MPSPPKQTVNPMHILIDGSLLVGHVGSVGTYTKELVTGLVGAGCTVTIAQPHRELNAAGAEILANCPDVRCILSDHESFPYDSYHGLLRWYHQLVPKIAEKCQPDVYVSVYHHTPMRMPLGTKRVTVIHDCCGLRADCGYRPMGRAMLKHWSHLKSAAMFADAIIPISAYTRSSFLHRFPQAKSKLTQPIYNAVTSAPINPDDAAGLLERHDLTRNGFLLALAMSSKRKGIDILLQGYELYRKQGGKRPLVFFGSGRIDPTRWGLSAETAGTIRLLGRVDDQLRDILYANATAFLFPSRCEGFGYPIVEAARRGCPVIAWQETTAPEILPEEQWMEKLQAQDVAAEIISKEAWTVQQRSSATDRLRRQAERFNSFQTADDFIRVFKSLLEA